MPALAIRLQRTGGGTGDDFVLQVENVSFAHDRSPIVIPLPGNPPQLIDLGQYKTQIKIEGVAAFPGTNETDGGIAIADKDDLETLINPTIAVPWFNRTITLTDNTDNSGTTYTVKIRSLTLDKRGPQNMYTFVLTCAGHLA